MKGVSILYRPFARLCCLICSGIVSVRLNHRVGVSPPISGWGVCRQKYARLWKVNRNE